MGSLSALMAIGLFDVQGGAATEPRWEITTPVFDRIKIHLDSRYYSGDTFTIEVQGDPSEDIYIQSATLNGEPLDRYWITHEEITSGGTLTLEVGLEPNKQWGVQSSSSSSTPQSDSVESAPLPPGPVETWGGHCCGDGEGGPHRVGAAPLLLVQTRSNIRVEPCADCRRPHG